VFRDHEARGDRVGDLAAVGLQQYRFEF